MLVTIHIRLVNLYFGFASVPGDPTKENPYAIQCIVNVFLIMILVCDINWATAIMHSFQPMLARRVYNL